MDPASKPNKRTALGRFKHENAEVTLAADGRVVVYMGDDERGEFLYRFVSDGVYTEGGDNADLLGSGSLSVARFADDGTGAWLALTPETAGMASQAEVCIHTRQAASAVGATTMDRPEWVAANPHKAETYCCLTNNKNRGVKPNAGGDLTPVGGPNPREKNNYGQIVRWMRLMAATTRPTPSPGTSTSSPATRRSMRTRTPAPPTSMRTTCSTRRTASPSTAGAASGSRPTASTPTRATSPARATT